ncbi:MAG: nickel pincer cofactor biosynthesis protein LarB [Actinomycetia bacterium]|nr:nickel pincer cofactor biosynthesis protein LarB [Actinomycetes bacterium]
MFDNAQLPDSADAESEVAAGAFGHLHHSSVMPVYPFNDGSFSLDGSAQLDYDRADRCGFPEVIFGAGKTPEQVAQIMRALAEAHPVVLCTRASAEQAVAAKTAMAAATSVAGSAAAPVGTSAAEAAAVHFVSSCGILYLDRREGNIRVSGSSAADILAAKGGNGRVVVCCAGTSDLPVAEEAALTARVMGSDVLLLADIGIAGLHRALGHTEELRTARVIVAVAGMEGALPSLIAGLVRVPVIAVPTSIGYGANFGGLAALLGMLNSCSMGVSVVNIDNGFGAGVIAHRINLPAQRSAE